jgi:carbamoyl-phosphate synthase small subunit
MQKAKLILQDGLVFEGYSFGSETCGSGEVVFNTGMVGYPETMTDPSYRGQILVLTYPLVGNYGVPAGSNANELFKNFESDKIQIQGMVVSEHSQEFSHWSAVKSLSDWMKENGVPGIYGIDTRALTKKLRSSGTMLGKIVVDGKDAPENTDPNLRNLAAEVSVKEPVKYGSGEKTVVVVDCGVKNNIIRSLVKRGVSVLRVPWNYNFLDIKADGVLISNGPGDPKMCGETIANVRAALAGNTPILGICLGSQILALAAGANTYKLKYGHRGQNQPCVEVGTKKCFITSQNHGFAVDAETLPSDWREWFVNDNDETNEGIIHCSKPFFGVQFHPEGAPGPDDSEFIFDMFIKTL